MNKDNGGRVNNDYNNGGGTTKETVDADDANAGWGTGPSSGTPSRTTTGDL